MHAGWRSRGGLTTIVAWATVAIGLVFFFVALGEGRQFVLTIQSTWLPEPALAVTLAFLLVGVAIALTGGGILAIGLAREERAREEERLLDPLRYAPFHSPSRKVLPWFAVVVAVLVGASLAVVPVAHAFHAEFAVTECAPGAPGSPYAVNLPDGAILTYSWNSSNGRPVAEVWAPDGPHVTANRTVTDAFFDSSYGYSTVESNGTPILFWACDPASGGSSSRSIVLTGTYYAWVL